MNFSLCTIIINSMVNKTGGTPRNSVSRVWSIVPRILRQGYIFSQKIIFFPPPPFFKIILFPPSTVQIGWYKYIRFFLNISPNFFLSLIPPFVSFLLLFPFFLFPFIIFFPTNFKKFYFFHPPPPSPHGAGGDKMENLFPCLEDYHSFELCSKDLGYVPWVWSDCKTCTSSANILYEYKVLLTNLKNNIQAILNHLHIRIKKQFIS